MPDNSKAVITSMDFKSLHDGTAIAEMEKIPKLSPEEVKRRKQQPSQEDKPNE